MINYAQARRILLRQAAGQGPMPIETVPLDKALGRIVAGAIACRQSLPAFDNSAMDGFSVKALMTSSARAGRPLRLKVLGSIAAGDAPLVKPAKGGIYEIMTGAPVPRGHDAVVKVEDAVILDGGRAVALRAAARKGDYIRRTGSDFRAGSMVAEPGTRLDPRHLLALGALGIDKVPVRRRPRVAMISTGRELAGPGLKLKPGQIHNATAAYLMACLPLAGAEVKFHGTVPDEPGNFRRRMGRVLAENPDAIVTTGAVSMGRHDFIADELRRLGARLLYHKVAIRPGKPGLAASFPAGWRAAARRPGPRWDMRRPVGPLFFGLPGNPVSTVVGARFFLAPYLRRLLGQADEKPALVRLAADASKPVGLRCFFKARVTARPSGLEARVLQGQGSHQIRPLLEANAWVVLPEQGSLARAGTGAEAYPLWPDSSGWEAPA